jgi:hypothetical protein
MLNTYIKKRWIWMIFTELHQKCEDYDTTKWLRLRSEVKELAILKKVEIEETNTYKTQIKKDYSDSIWIILNLDVN